MRFAGPAVSSSTTLMSVTHAIARCWNEEKGKTVWEEIFRKKASFDETTMRNPSSELRKLPRKFHQSPI